MYVTKQVGKWAEEISCERQWEGSIESVLESPLLPKKYLVNFDVAAPFNAYSCSIKFGRKLV
jgi:hypothetical protein